MAKQTINIGASPNDGTGTPLRTAFDYTNQNFTELYTATGPSGNNIVVPGSATITGDLTVDTSTLKVDSANNRVGIRTASPAEPLTVDNSSGVTTGAIRIYAIDQSHSRLAIQNGNGQAYHLVAGNPGASNAGFALYDNTAAATRLYVDSTGVHTWQNVGGVAGTAMTLNSTGLGVGVSPSSRLDVANTATPVIFSMTLTGAQRWQQIIDTTAGNWTLRDQTGSIDALIVKAGSGNVGIGVTPSAWQAGLKALQFGGNGVLYANGTNTAFVGSNYYTDSSGTNRYIVSNVAAAYGQVTGAHQWFTAPSGTAGNAITFTQAMTLDASGNLLVGKTSIGTTVGIEVRPDGYLVATRSATTDGAGFTNAVYSSGAAAYRFYVGMGGTVFATNTTISGISDARLKENVQDLDVGLGAILALKPRKFDWKAGKGKDIKGDRGFIAQEFETVFPQLVDEWADPAPEGEAPYKSVRQDLIPVLVKAIQELTARVQTLEAK